MSSHSTKHKFIQEIDKHRIGFSLSFIIIFTVAFVVLATLDLLPDPTAKYREGRNGTPVAPSGAVSNSPYAAGEAPLRISIRTIGLDANISNPDTTNAGVLDAALLRGAVRWPSSAGLGVNGTVLLFGHSSYLPVVRNQAYKTFDDIQKLKTGNTISVYSATKEYRYSVTGVRVANVDDADTNRIPLLTDSPHLTLITCDSFATKSDRFVVTADFVGAYSLTR